MQRTVLLSFRVQRTLSDLSYAFLVVGLICASGMSCVVLLSQAVRTSANQSWRRNLNALVIGASYIVLFVASLLFCLKRRVAVRQRLHRISKVHKTIGQCDAPKAVHDYIALEYTRACLVAYQSQPKDVFHDGWGRPGTKYCGIRFRRALLNTIPEINALSHLVIPTHPALNPHACMLHHFRFILPLLPIDEDGLSSLHYYDSVIQLARNATQEPTEEEFRIGMKAAAEILKSLHECRLEMLEDSKTQLNGSASSES